MVRSGEREIAKEKIYAAKKNLQKFGILMLII